MSDPLGAALRPFIAALEELAIPYYVGGSIMWAARSSVCRTVNIA